MLVQVPRQVPDARWCRFRRQVLEGCGVDSGGRFRRVVGSGGRFRRQVPEGSGACGVDSEDRVRKVPESSGTTTFTGIII